MKKRLKTFLPGAVIATSLLLTACNTTPVANSNKTETVDYFANDGLGNALAIVQHPAGVHVDGITYVSYQGPLEDPYVASYNHKTKQWSGPFKAGVSTMGKDPSRTKIDNHGKPTMIIDDLGYIHIFYGGHGGTDRHGANPLGNKHYGENRHSVSKRPYDISEWQEMYTIPVFGTYNQAVKMDNGDIYLFYRHGAHRSDWVYHKSTDHGRTFEPAVSFLKHKKRTDIRADDSWYAWVSKGHGDDIIVSYDYHVCWDYDAGINGRGHTTQRHDAYYMVFNTKTNTWRNVKGEPVTIPVTREHADKTTLVARTGKNWTFNGSAHLDENGYPHISTNIGRDLGHKTGGPKQTSYFRWNGSEWLGGNPVNTQARKDNLDTRGDFKIHSPTDITFTLGYEESNTGIIADFNSQDGGKTFTKTKELLRRPGAQWALSALIDNAHPDARMIVAEKQRNSNWHRIYLVGDKGPIGRTKSDANVLKPDAVINMTKKK
ncbi:hypothetical protein C2869_03785 [Saccharobesus litoralis]|uniref:BNR repeat-containing family member n=1 Tax=Saccharobesus litoralis TaxID=2172099 RepID=A0A2S0VNF0_9ALTE|nr:BNR-4 repeat-containing protein [Saccharobesus litoralis]AWB65610.1 hypothetical protein C2869_03785 [Saccharobesus litoralis]